MGNNNVTPAKHAIASYSNFLEPLSPDAKTINNADFVNQVEHKFNVFLEDFLVNDETFQGFKETPVDARTCLAAILLTHTAFVLTLADKKTGWNAGIFCQQWQKGISSEELVIDLLSLENIYLKGQLYRWEESRWVVCNESDVTVNKTKFNFDFTIGPCDFSSTLVEEARNWAQNKVNECKEIIDNLDVSKIVTAVKDHKIEANAAEDKLPCYSITVNLTKSLSRSNKKSHFFTTRLPYDPSSETTSVVDRFVNAFSCSKEDLATHLSRWGCRTKPSVTVIVGPASSGKTTLCKVAQALYGPFTTSSDKEGDKADYDLVRTCFFDEILDEHQVAAHPCRHLVFTSLENALEEKPGDGYGGREVFTLVLDSPINPEKSSPNAVSTVTTLKQLGSLLGWCLKNSGNPLQSSSSSMSNTLMKMLMGAMNSEGCGNPNCTNCTKPKSEETTKPTSTEIPVPTKVHRFGRTGVMLSYDTNCTKPKSEETPVEVKSEESDDEPSVSTKVFRLGANGLTQVLK